VTQDDVLQMFKDRGALLQGHFKLTSGLHSDSYLQCARLLQYPVDADRLGAELARKIKKQAAEHPIGAVIAPAIGGIVLGYVLARALGARAIFAERVDGQFALRRGFALVPGEQVIVAEDVITTGGSVREVAALVEGSDAHVAGFAAVAERGEVETKLAAPKYVLLRMSLVTYPADSCPMCNQGLPLVKPGSRPEPARKS
jgi:orotate phosphoribosyltransferase